ncbi:MAG TPA: GNAT family N-acetyltransferase [Gemmatimonadales bacterium]|nr:GNAT family N-acetyltransferase [Gemmatimonadales bacterium]
MEIREASLPADRPAIERLWLDYLVWVNDTMQARRGIHPHDPRQAVADDLAHIAKFLPPTGHLLLVEHDKRACGIGCLRTIAPGIGEIKRMYLEPAARGGGMGRALLQALVDAARVDGHTKVRLDSLDFMTDAHRLYRRLGFYDIPVYPESEIADAFQPYMVFMELAL